MKTILRACAAFAVVTQVHAAPITWTFTGTLTESNLFDNGDLTDVAAPGDTYTFNFTFDTATVPSLSSGGIKQWGGDSTASLSVNAHTFSVSEAGGFRELMDGGSGDEQYLGIHSGDTMGGPPITSTVASVHTIEALWFVQDLTLVNVIPTFDWQPTLTLSQFPFRSITFAVYSDAGSFVIEEFGTAFSTFSSSASAPAVPAPAPTAMATFGLGLIALSAARRRRSAA